LKDNELSDDASGLAASGQRRLGSASPSVALDVAVSAALHTSESGSLPAAVARVAEAWPSLSPHIREAILTLVDAGDVRTE